MAVPMDLYIPRDSNMLAVGMKRIVSIARVMLCNPSILLTDELMSSEQLTLDEIRKETLHISIRALQVVCAHTFACACWVPADG